jgi:hypothetical protein
MASVEKLCIYLSLFCVFLRPEFTSAKPLTLPEAELQLNRLLARISLLRDESDKRLLSDSITLFMQQTLSLAGSFDYPFHGISKMGKIQSPDGKIRIYTWNIPWADGTNTYYGFLQYKRDEKNDIRLLELKDQSVMIKDPEQNILTAEQWYGMLIYEIVEKKFNDRYYYTLLGYDNENPFLSRKIVDVLYFFDKHEPRFGKAMFHYRGKLCCRILFEYSAKVQMSLKWNEQLKMIVFDHLSPSKKSFTGNYQFYGPDFSYDGLRFENGIWELVEDVDVRNVNDGQVRP